MSCRSKIQICRKKNFHNVGFFDPDIIHEQSVAQMPEDIVNVIYRGLRKNQSFKSPAMAAAIAGDSC